MNPLEHAVLDSIRQQTGSEGGARFPSPVPLWYRGEPTIHAKSIGLVVDGKVVLDAERRVYAAVKKLHAEGEVTFLFRFGYTWVVPSRSHEILNPRAGDEHLTRPTDAPYYWDELE